VGQGKVRQVSDVRETIHANSSMALSYLYVSIDVFFIRTTHISNPVASDYYRALF